MNNILKQLNQKDLNHLETFLKDMEEKHELSPKELEGLGIAYTAVILAFKQVNSQ